MTETVHIKCCPVCSSALNITVDPSSDEIRIRPENLPPLVKDKVSVVAAYKRLKGLGAHWEKTHGARGIIYAGTLLESVGYAGGQLDRAIGLMEWLQSSGRDWDLGSAPCFFSAFQKAQQAAKEAARGPRCKLCLIPDPSGIGLCPDHLFCWVCREGLENRKWSWDGDYAVCEMCLEARKPL